MIADMTVDLMSATVQLEQPLGKGTRTVATGFLVSDPTPDGRPRTVLITAGHVFEGMSGDDATIGYRVQGADGTWSFAPKQFPIRAAGKPLWTRNPARDVAAIVISAPPSFAKAAIPMAWLASDDTLAKYQLTPGEEMMTLGFPQGLSANPAGFPILRSGRVASYPLGPSTAYPTFLLDFRVFPGNSGGPVWLDEAQTPGASDDRKSPVIAGLLTQQVEKGDQNLGIGIVTQAQFIRDTLSLLDSPAVVSPRAAAAAGTFATDTSARRR
jgi:S1-C subfamily serine protease